MEIWTALLLGMVGGVHCAGMCGPLMLALPATGGGPMSFLGGRLTYHAGRIFTYGGLGLMAGWLGQTVSMAGAQRGLSIGLGVLLVTGVVASPRLGTNLWIVRGIGRLKRTMAAFLQRRGSLALGTLGALNGLLPCGLVYAAFAGAATTGGPLPGAEFMMLFGLGTVPITLGISLSGRLMPSSLRIHLRHLLPASVVVVGCLLILRGMSLGIPYLSPDLAGAGPAACHPLPH